jgi:hypothetical protein
MRGAWAFMLDAWKYGVGSPVPPWSEKPVRIGWVVSGTPSNSACQIGCLPEFIADIVQRIDANVYQMTTADFGRREVVSLKLQLGATAPFSL